MDKTGKLDKKRIKLEEKEGANKFTTDSGRIESQLTSNVVQNGQLNITNSGCLNQSEKGGGELGRIESYLTSNVVPNGQLNITTSGCLNNSEVKWAEEIENNEKEPASDSQEFDSKSDYSTSLMPQNETAESIELNDGGLLSHLDRQSGIHKFFLRDRIGLGSQIDRITNTSCLNLPVIKQRNNIDPIEIIDNTNVETAKDVKDDEMMPKNEYPSEEIGMPLDSNRTGKVCFGTQRHLSQSFSNTRMTSQISKFEQADSNLTEQGIIKKVKRDKIKVKSANKNIKNALISNKNSPKSGLKRSMRDRSRLASQTNRNTDNTDRNKKG